MLMPGQEATVAVTVTVPGETALGTMDHTILTATSQVSPTLLQHVVNLTLVPNQRTYLPIIVRH
jgi:hypothetical protein